MSTLALKLRRDMGRQKGQFLAVFVAVFLGVALFAGTYNSYLNLGTSLESTYDRLAMPDVTVSGVDASFADAVEALDGVEVATTRRVADVPIDIGQASFLGRAIGMPVGEPPELADVDVDRGEYLADETGVLLEAHTATEFDAGVGDEVTVAGRSGRVVGVVTSPEYLWMARDRQNIFTAPGSFGVVFVAEEALAAASGPAVVDQVLVGYRDGVDREAIDARVTDLAEAAVASDVELLADQPSNATIHLEIDGLRTMAVALPLLFLAAAGLAVYVVVTRLVYAQRGVIGTLRAQGFSRRQMSRHYRLYGVTVGVAGAALGAVAGGFLAWGMTAIYVEVFEIPDLVAELHVPTVAMALVFGLTAGLLASAPPARAVARLAPAEAMRGDPPVDGGRRSLLERIVPPLRRAPVRWRMGVRGIGRNRRRSLSMVIGVVLSMVLILAGWGVIDTMLLAIDRQFNEVSVEDATVVPAVPVDDGVLDEIAAVDGVDVAEPVIGLGATIRAGDRTYTTLVEGYREGTAVHGFDSGLPSDGILLGRAMRDLLDVDVGDAVRVEPAAFEAGFDTAVAGFVDEPLGTVGYVEQEHLVDSVLGASDAVTQADLAVPSVTTVKVRYADGVDPDVVVERLRGLDVTAAVVDSAELRALVEDYQLFFYVFIGMMVVFGGAMAFALVFNIVSVNVAERRGEFASMRANGLTRRRVASMITAETALLTTIGLVPGLLLGHVAAVAFTNSFSTDQFPIVAELRPASYVGVVVAMAVVVGLSLLPAVRAIRRIDVAATVRERAT